MALGPSDRSISRVELELGAGAGVSVDAAALAIVRVASEDASIALVAAGGGKIAFAPGEYFIELSVRAMEAQAAPRLQVSLPDGRLHVVSLSEVAPARWRGVLYLSETAQSLSLNFGAAGCFVFGGASIATDSEAESTRVSLVQAGISLLRAIFAKLPSKLRVYATKSQRRARWLRRVRAVSGQEPLETIGGRFIGLDRDTFDLRADFENRFAAARSLRRAPEDDGQQIVLPAQAAAKLIAYYLPQFHPIPENDAWWGKGFTEWSNVAKAQPQFLGHYQPRLPGELGFYDLRTPGVLKAQASLARTHGIGAFCFHYYWFAGKRLLERPIEIFLADPSIDIDFCLCWANENWTRRWDGEETNVLIEQSHTLSDHMRVFDDIARHMTDPRYLKVDGKPMLVVYRPAIIENASEMTTLWRQEAEKRGWPGIYLVATNAFAFDEPAALGFDAISEFPPHGIVGDPIAGSLQWLNRGHKGRVFSYEDVARQQARSLHNSRNAAVTFPGVMPGWDNEARRPGAGVIYHGATPDAYGGWLKAAIEAAGRSLPADRRFVFINAWNEWAEGAHLEPDRMNGRAFLIKTAQVLSAASA